MLHRSLTENLWVVLLAAGDGTRLQSMTTDRNGTAVPKQYCSLYGGPTLLAETRARGAAVTDDDRIVAVVSPRHRRWWRRDLWTMRNENVIVQPDNRGTANGVLLAALTIAGRDPFARVVFLPSDHYARDEQALRRAIRRLAVLPLAAGELGLLGLRPSAADPELGYIQPDAAARERDAARVARFVEKPEPRVAHQLVREGALWNSFIFSSDVSSVLQLVRMRHPEVVDSLETALARGYGALCATYERLPSLDFSRHVLQGAEPRLRVVEAADCGWSDLGTPGRVSEALRSSTHRLPASHAPTPGGLVPAAVNLSTVCVELERRGALG